MNENPEELNEISGDALNELPAELCEIFNDAGEDYDSAASDKKTEELIDNIKKQCFICIAPTCKKISINDEKLIKIFMQQINVIIGGNTVLNYHIIPVFRLNILIPVNAYTNEDAEKSTEDYAMEQIDKIQQFFEQFSLKNTNKQFLWLFRNVSNIMERYSVTMSEAFEISCDYIGFKDFLHLQKIAIEYPKIDEIKLIDGSIIGIYVDKYIKDFGVYVDISKNFNELSYFYNALHLYEHLMTYAWKETAHLNQSYINGLTIINGISNVYTVLNDKNDILNYLSDYIEFAASSRRLEFWETQAAKDMLKTETKRTISEEMDARNFSIYTRSDPTAYRLEYDYRLFCKWSQEPFNILILTDSPLDIPADKFNAIILNNSFKKITIEKPKFNYIPVECFADKRQSRVLKIEPAEIVKRILEKNYKNNEIFGIDCFIHFTNDYILNFSYFFHVVLYLRKYVKNDDLNAFFRSVIIPKDCTMALGI